MGNTKYDDAFKSEQLQDDQVAHENPESSLENRSIAGFLVTFSDSISGKYWALREGRNLIGRSDDCEIILFGQAVSDRHAILNVRRSKNDNRLMYVIVDQTSTNGVFINGEDIEYQPKECKNLDRIQIGDYDLLLISIDKAALNLKSNEKLIVELCSKPLANDNSDKYKNSFTDPYGHQPANNRKQTKIEVKRGI